MVVFCFISPTVQRPPIGNTISEILEESDEDDQDYHDDSNDSTSTSTEERYDSTESEEFDSEGSPDTDEDGVSIKTPRLSGIGYEGKRRALGGGRSRCKRKTSWVKKKADYRSRKEEVVYRKLRVSTVNVVSRLMAMANGAS